MIDINDKDISNDCDLFQIKIIRKPILCILYQSMSDLVKFDINDSFVPENFQKNDIQKIEKITIAIIGTSGRKEDFENLSLQVYDYIVSKTEHIILNEWNLNWNHVHLISGGAAWRYFIHHFELIIPVITLQLHCF
jgi:hypothetical protein